MVPGDVVHQVPLFSVLRDTVEALELFDALVDLPVGSQSVGSGEELAADLTRMIPLLKVNGLDMVVKRNIGLIFVPADVTAVFLI